MAAVSSSDVWAVGGYPGAAGAVEHWDGSAWKLAYIARAPALASGAILTGIAASATGGVWIVGYVTSSTAIIPLSYHWNGSHWLAARTPYPGLDAELMAASAAPDGSVFAAV